MHSSQPPCTPAGASRATRFHLPLVLLLLGGLAAQSQAQPVLQGVIEEVMRFSVFGGAPRTVGSPRADLNTTYDLGEYEDAGSIVQGRLDLEAWAEASVVAGTPTFRAYLHWNGNLPPIGNRPSGSFGANVFGTYEDHWTVNLPGVPAGTLVRLRPSFHTHGTFRTFPPGSVVLLTGNFFPLFGPSRPVPAPAPQVGVFTYFNLGYGGDSRSMPGGVVSLAPFWDPLGFEVRTGTPFRVYFEGGGGYAVAMRDVAATFADPNAPWSTRGTYDASATVQLSGLELFDSAGVALTGFDVLDSSGALVVPAAIPEPSAWAAFAGGVALAVALGRRRREVSGR